MTYAHIQTDTWHTKFLYCTYMIVVGTSTLVFIVCLLMIEETVHTYSLTLRAVNLGN